MNSPQKEPTYAFLLKLLRKAPSPKTLLGQAIASAIGGVIVIGGTFKFYKLQGKDILSTVTPFLFILG
jgi:hypothetical protein